MFDFSEQQVINVQGVVGRILGRDVELLELFSEGVDLVGAIAADEGSQPFRLETRLKLDAVSISEFAESKGVTVSDRVILEQIRNDLETRIGRVDRVYGVSVTDKDIFYGKAQKKLNATRSEIFSFKIDPGAGRVTYKMDNAEEALKYGETDEAWSEMYEFAAKGKGSRAGKALNCRPGNMQCGGKCQKGSMAYPSQMSEEERKAYKAAARKARTGSKKVDIGNEKQEEPQVRQSRFESSSGEQSAKEMASQWESFVNENNSIYDDDDDLLLDNRGVVSDVIAEAGENPNSLVAIRDGQGNIQAGATIQEDGDSNSIYVNLLATAPWNAARIGDARSVKGAGTAAIVEIAQRSIDAGFEGRITLSSLRRAVPFYEALGFRETGKGRLHYELTPEAAQTLIRRFRS